jgi:2-octaprenyl-6-methoxyphenol hydroxylase
VNTATPTNAQAAADCAVAICGAGPVGLALAALLAKQGLEPQQICLIDGKTLAQACKDPRSIALSYGSRQILESLGAWPIAATEIHQIHVSRRGHFGRTLIDRSEHKLPALGYVSRYGAIVEALARVCEQHGVRTLRPMQVSGHMATTDEVCLQLQAAGSGTTCTTDTTSTTDTPTTAMPTGLLTQILVQAEGGLFASQQHKAVHRNYQQTAIIAQVRASNPILQRAFERFTDEGPLALLPQHDGSPGAHAYALVWCVRPEHAETLLALDDAAFLAALGQAFGNRLGRFTTTGPRMGFPLGLNAQPNQRAANGEPARVVAIGNAAQTLHPVAGQGLNLGLRDAVVLARQLAQGISPASLQRFEQVRQGDRNTTVRLTDTMARVFASGNALQQGVLGATLGLLDAFDPAKNLLAEMMMFGRR